MDRSRKPISGRQDQPENILNCAAIDSPALLLKDEFISADPKAIAISIVSNSRLLGEGLFLLLSPYLNLRLIGTYVGEFSIISPLPNPPDHVILLDSGVGRAAALSWTRHWHGLMPPTYVLVVELADNVELILACLDAGADGYLLQGAAVAEVVEAIKEAYRNVAHRSSVVTAQLITRLTASKATAAQPMPSPLTVREVEVLHWIVQGYTNLEISVQLFIELRTVKQHVHHILGKLHLRSRWEVARLAAERGWVDLM